MLVELLRPPIQLSLFLLLQLSVSLALLRTQVFVFLALPTECVLDRPTTIQDESSPTQHRTLTSTSLALPLTLSVPPPHGVFPIQLRTRHATFLTPPRPLAFISLDQPSKVSSLPLVSNDHAQFHTHFSISPILQASTALALPPKLSDQLLAKLLVATSKPPAKLLMQASHFLALAIEGVVPQPLTSDAPIPPPTLAAAVIWQPQP